MKITISFNNSKSGINFSCDNLPEGLFLRKDGLLTNCISKIKSQPFFGETKMKVELTFISRNDEHVICEDELGKEHELPEYVFDGIPKMWQPGQMIIANLEQHEIESYDIFV